MQKLELKMIPSPLSMLTAAWVVLLAATTASSQQQPGTTVQLPVMSFFSGATTVRVPDRGQILIGSVKRSSTGVVSRGVPILGSLPMAGRLFRNQAVGQSNSTSTLSATVQIHDLREMDRALLEQARKDRVLKTGGPSNVKRLAEKKEIKRKADFITRHLGRNANPKR